MRIAVAHKQNGCSSLLQLGAAAHCSHPLHDVGWSFASPQITNVRWSCALAHRSYFFYNVGWSLSPCITYIPSAARNIAVLIALLASSPRRKMDPCAFSDHLDLLPESFGFLPPSPVWVGRFFTKSTKSGFFIHPIRSGLFTNLTSSAFGFPPQFPTGLGGFSPIACSLIFWFSSSVFPLG